MIERLMRGMTLDFAVTRVFELETKKEFPINRLMVDNYLSSLKRGMKKNRLSVRQSTSTCGTARARVR